MPRTILAALIFLMTCNVDLALRCYECITGHGGTDCVMDYQKAMFIVDCEKSHSHGTRAYRTPVIEILNNLAGRPTNYSFLEHEQERFRPSRATDYLENGRSNNSSTEKGNDGSRGSRAAGYPVNGDYQCAKIKVELKHMNIVFVTVVRECFAPETSCSEIFKEAEDIGAPHLDCQTCSSNLCNADKCYRPECNRTNSNPFYNNGTDLLPNSSSRIEMNYLTVLFILFKIFKYHFK